MGRAWVIVALQQPAVQGDFLRRDLGALDAVRGELFRYGQSQELVKYLYSQIPRVGAYPEPERNLNVASAKSFEIQNGVS